MPIIIVRLTLVFLIAATALFNLLWCAWPNSNILYRLYKVAVVPMPKVFVMPTLIRRKNIRMITASHVLDFPMYSFPGPYIFRRAVEKLIFQPGELSSLQRQAIFQTYYCTQTFRGEKLRFMVVTVQGRTFSRMLARYVCPAA